MDCRWITLPVSSGQIYLHECLLFRIKLYHIPHFLSQFNFLVGNSYLYQFGFLKTFPLLRLLISMHFSENSIKLSGTKKVCLQKRIDTFSQTTNESLNNSVLHSFLFSKSQPPLWSSSRYHNFANYEACMINWLLAWTDFKINLRIVRLV